MKKLFTMLFVILITTAAAFSQNKYQDVVYLKNGSVIRGVIIEQAPDTLLKIQTADSSVFVFKMEEVEKITQEPVITPHQPVTRIITLESAETAASATMPPPMKYSFLGGSIDPYGGKKYAILAGVLSYLLPGLGQFYNGDIYNGMFYLSSIMLIPSTMIIALVNNSPEIFVAGFMGWIVIYISGIVNAANNATRVNIARGYRVARNTHIDLTPSMMHHDFASSNFNTYGLSLQITF
ncbi:MAG: hypothetical protein LBT48_00180 [Prevotellaceae bacterium]|nr:hypothetical protein [Prevotellaceae bacterium]